MNSQHTIAAITPTICALFGIPPPAVSSPVPLGPVLDELKTRYGLTKIDKCLVYAPDALGARFMKGHSEIFASMSAAAPVSVELRSMYPPKTPVCFASMFTGAPPEAHGIRKPERPVLACDTLFDALIRAGKKPAIAAVKGSSIDLIFRGREMDYFSEDYDPQVTARALRLLEGDEHGFILAYHQEYDDSLHATTIGSGRSLAAARHHVADFIRLCEAFNKHWSRHDRLAVFAPDHGGHDDTATGQGTHGDDIPDDMLVTHFFAAARGV
jgi:hypothetical protein